MAKYFTTDGRFAFPDSLFPAATLSPSVPLSATKAEASFESQYAALRNIPDSPKLDIAYVEWARKLLNFAELYGYSNQPLLEHAKSVIAAAAEGSTTSAGLACYTVGNWYLFGLHGTAPDPSKSREYFKQAIKKGCSRAWYRMAANAEARGDIKNALSRYENGARLGDIACIYRIGMAKLLGHLGMEKDTTSGLEMFNRSSLASDEDFPQPAYLLGKLYLKEMGDMFSGSLPTLAQDKQKGIALIEKAASLGFSPAIMRMASAYQGGEKGYDCTTALRYLHLAARQERYLVFQGSEAALHGEPEAQLVKWFLVGFEDVIKKNEEWAYKFAAAGSELGNSTAQFALGYFAEVGIYCSADRQKAIDHYKESAKNKCAAAITRLESLEGPPSRKPSLRRTLTRKDHEATLSKHGKRLAGAVSSEDIRQLAESVVVEEDDEPDVSQLSIKSETTRPYPASPPRTTPKPYPVSPEPLLSKPEPSLPYPSSPGAAKQLQAVQEVPEQKPVTPYPDNSKVVRTPSVRSEKTQTPYPNDDPALVVMSRQSTRESIKTPYPSEPEAPKEVSSPASVSSTPYPLSSKERASPGRESPITTPSRTPYPSESNGASPKLTKAPDLSIDSNKSPLQSPGVSGGNSPSDSRGTFPDRTTSPPRGMLPRDRVSSASLRSAMSMATQDSEYSVRSAPVFSSPPKRGEKIRRKPVTDRIVSVPIRELDIKDSPKSMGHNRSKTMAFDAGAIPAPVPAPATRVPSSVQAPEKSQKPRVVSSHPIKIPPPVPTASRTSPTPGGKLPYPSSGASAGTSASSSAPTTGMLSNNRKVSTPAVMPSRAAAADRTNDRDSTHKKGHGRTRSLSPLKKFWKLGKEEEEQKPVKSSFEVIRPTIENTPPLRHPIDTSSSVLERPVSPPKAASPSSPARSMQSWTASPTSLHSDRSPSPTHEVDQHTDLVSNYRRPRSPQRHARGMSVQVGATNAPVSTGKRLASMPVQAVGGQASPVNELPPRRPGVAYSFEEMGVKTVTSESDGKCTVM